MEISDFFQVFYDEAEELLAEKERLLLGLDPQAFDMADIDAIFRVAHSIKGGAATFGLSDMTGVTHVLESLLDRLRKGDAALTPEHIDVFLASKDVLQMQLRGHREGTPIDETEVTSVLQRLKALSAADSIPALPLPAAEVAEQKRLRTLKILLPQTAAADIAALSEELALLGRITPLAEESGRSSFLLETPESEDDVRAICSFIVDPDLLDISAPAALVQTAQSPISHTVASHVQAPVQPAVAVESSSIRVSVDKVDQLINLVGELVITQAMIEQRTHGLDPMLHEKLLQGVSQLTRNTRHLQEAVMSIRMIPMSMVFNRFPRMLRDLAAKLGKKVELVTHGEATELDKGLVEKITDPLTHLVRNSCDHGIESPADRVAQGKPETGTITLVASHQGGSIVIEVRDDGRGLSRQKLLSKARERGIDAPDSLTDSEVWSLIFAPGFSTAEVVTDVSGRGVGMDVVKRNITSLGGTVEIDAAEGYGMTVRVRLPLTLAIMDGMSVGVGQECYILPLASVVESFQVKQDTIRTIGSSGRVVEVRGEYMPVIELEQVFAVPRLDQERGPPIMVVVEAEGGRSALLVDVLLGQQQVVVKNLESNYRKVQDVSGATIMGDGRVALILDVAALLRRSRH